MKSFNRIRKLVQTINDFIDEKKLNNVTIADIGADHGYLAEILTRNDKISKVFATDISKKCLNKTEELIKNNNLDKVETRLGDGLEPIDETDIVVVAGIGGYEIINMISNQNITKNGKIKSRFFVLEPSKNTVELREFLFDNNYAILKDFIIESAGRYYSIIVVDVCEKCDTERNIFNTYFGRDNSAENPEFLGFLKFQIELFDFLNELSETQIEADEKTKIKHEIYKLSKKILNEEQGD